MATVTNTSAEKGSFGFIFRVLDFQSIQRRQVTKGEVRAMTRTQADSRTPTQEGRVFSEQLHRIREVHIEVESILQSLAALQEEQPCARCTSVCCKEVMCRESLDSDFLRFLLGPRAEAYSADAGWYVPGSGCRLSYGRPLVCYEYFCEQFEDQNRSQLRQLSRVLKTLYANAFAGQHMLVVEDIGRISANKLNLIHARLEKLRDMANAALRRSLSEKLGMQSTGNPN
jgi:hypothetical protein